MVFLVGLSLQVGLWCLDESSSWVVWGDTSHRATPRILHVGVQLLLGNSACSRVGRQRAWLAVGWFSFLGLFLQFHSTLQSPCQLWSYLEGTRAGDLFSVITVTRRCLDLMTCHLACWARCSELVPLRVSLLLHFAAHKVLLSGRCSGTKDVNHCVQVEICSRMPLKMSNKSL